MVLAKDMVYELLTFDNQCIELHCRKFRKGKLIQKLKNE